MEYINTDNILKAIREYVSRCYGDKPEAIKLNPEDIKYLQSEMGFNVLIDGQISTLFGLRIIEDKDMQLNIGEFRIIGMPRLKKWL